MPGRDIIIRTAEITRELAFTREDATMFLASETPQPEAAEARDVGQVETAEGLANVWHAVIDERVKWWTGESSA
jgi:hypothetical protein